MTFTKFTFLLFTASVLAVSCKKKGCTDPDADNYSAEAKKDDGSCSFAALDVPSTFVFQDESGNSTVSYSGQTDRLNQLEEMTSYMKTGSTVPLDNMAIKCMFANAGDNGGGNFSFSSTKQLKNKCYPADTSVFLNWIDSLTLSSIDFATTASNGQAGILNSGADSYLFSANGIEYTQLIEKGLMGAVFMYQATQVYFGSGKMNVDNTTAVDAGDGKYYTEMEHHWDEAFGYFGAPTDFPTNTDDLRFWAKYCNSQNDNINSNSTMMTAFLTGRAVISQGFNLVQRDQQITVIREMWERISASQAVTYLEGAQANFGTDPGKFLHELSEAYAFIHSLKYVPLETRVITFTEIDELLETTIGDNFWEVTSIDLTAAINELNGIYNF